MELCRKCKSWSIYRPGIVQNSTQVKNVGGVGGRRVLGVLVRYNKTNRQLAGKNNRIKKRRGGRKKEKITIEKFCNTRRERGLRCAALLCSAAVSYQTLAIVFSCVFCAHSLQLHLPPTSLRCPLITRTDRQRNREGGGGSLRQPNALFGVIKEFKLHCQAKCAEAAAATERQRQRQRKRARQRLCKAGQRRNS